MNQTKCDFEKKQFFESLFLATKDGSSYRTTIESDKVNGNFICQHRSDVMRRLD